MCLEISRSHETPSASEPPGCGIKVIPYSVHIDQVPVMSPVSSPDHRYVWHACSLQHVVGHGIILIAAATPPAEAVKSRVGLIALRARGGIPYVCPKPVVDGICLLRLGHASIGYGGDDLCRIGLSCQLLLRLGGLLGSGYPFRIHRILCSVIADLRIGDRPAITAPIPP